MTETLYEYEKARRWRESRRYTRKQLSELTGYSESSINDFETGIVRSDRTHPVSQSAMRRYRLVLAALTNGLENWDWEEGK